MDAAQKIRDAVERVSTLRQDARSTPGLGHATAAVKAFQARRFAGTYADLLASPEYACATRFFLSELYSDKDYSERDAQFSRIAGALQTLFPAQVVATSVSLAQLHVLTEELDHQMATAWIQSTSAGGGDIPRYMSAWNAVGRRQDRLEQLSLVLTVGAELDRMTRMPGLRLMLKMMRRPASAAGLASLQTFLEAGFDTFASMSGKSTRTPAFFNTIRTRESEWIDRLFFDATHCDAALQECLNR